jgi:hypothetical protein
MGAAPLASGAPRPAPNDHRGQVSWLPDRHRRPAFPDMVQWHCGARLPGHSCGGSAGLRPASLGRLALAGPASRAIRDVGGEINGPGVVVHLWHGAAAAHAAPGVQA